MTLRTTFAVVIASSLTTLLLLLLVTTNTSAQTATSLSIDVGTPSGCAEIKEGDEIVVELLIENVSELQTWEATIVHDRDILEIVSQDVLLFLAEEPGSNVVGAATEPLPDFNGRHLLSAGDLGASSESGDGVLAQLVFKAVGSGTTSIGIPQFDINHDGKTDEGALLTAYGSVPIGDVNGDYFFDGDVEPGTVAVEEDCGAVETSEPTDPPTAVPSSPVKSGDGDGDSPNPSDNTPVDSGEPPVSGRTPGADTPTAANSENPSATGSVGATTSDGTGSSPAGQPSDDNGGGSSFPVWLIAALLAGGLAMGAAIVVLAMRRSSGAAL
jgi:hypothetical protein